MTEYRGLELTPSSGLDQLPPRPHGPDPRMDEARRLRDLIVRAPRTGLYVHIPFCSSLCPYCDFAVVVGREEDHARYVDALIEEARIRLDQQPWDSLHTLFIGGGTPTYIDIASIERLLQATHDLFGWRPDIEITIEANPESVTREGMRRLVAAGVNRVSLGVQSFDPKILDALGRNHPPEAIGPAVDAIRSAGVAKLNLDLIYGTPGESRYSWRKTLQEALSFDPDHLSAYALQIEERTAFGHYVEIGEMAEPDDDIVADDLETTLAYCRDHGLMQYELSNFAVPGAECRHNLGIWCGGDYLGLGIGAHSLRGGTRWRNGRSLRSYLESPGDLIEETETQDARARAEEWLNVRIRLRAGFPEVVGEQLLPGLIERAEPLVQEGLLERMDGYLRSTLRGMLLDNAVSGRLIGPDA